METTLEISLIYEFKSREDAEKLMAKKLNPKNRNNEKGRNMELQENIKKI